MTLLRRLRHLGENNLALKLFALALATLLYFAVRPVSISHHRKVGASVSTAHVGLTAPRL